MAPKPTTPNLDNLSISDTELDETEDLFASPSIPKTSRVPLDGNGTQDGGEHRAPATGSDSEEDAFAAHEAALRRELASLHSMNQVISGITASLEKAKSNMDTVAATVDNASTLLNTWTRVLSQTEHNQRLILNPNWHGATQDVLDGENEELLRQQEKERRKFEETRKAKEREAEREEEERRKLTAGVGSKTGRPRGRGTSRGTVRAGTGYVGVGGQSGFRGTTRGLAGSGRSGSSGIGRGVGGIRGRGRGP